MMGVRSSLPFFLNILVLIHYISGSPRVDPLVDTKLGLIRGLKASDGDYSKFLGIPYGKVNDSNPFGVSAPYPKFDDVYEAYEDFVACPQSVGGSAGGMSTDLHLASNSEKLFSQVLIQSGNSLSPVYYDPVKDAPIGLAKQLGFETANLYEALVFISSIDTDLVIGASKELEYNFTPCMEKEFEDIENFLTADWIKADRPKAKNMPILIGFNSDESFTDYYKVDEFFEGIKSKIEDKLAFGFDIHNDKFNEIVEVVKKFYIPDDSVEEDVRLGWVYFDTDWTFSYPTERVIDKYIQNTAGNVYYYVFSYVGELSSSRRSLNATQFGAAHGDEVHYLFDTGNEDVTPEDQSTIDRLTALWTNFVKYGDPTPETSELLPVKWKPNTIRSPRYYLDINSELSVKTRPQHQRCVFWDLVYKVYEDQQICPSCGGWRK